MKYRPLEPLEFSLKTARLICRFRCALKNPQLQTFSSLSNKANARLICSGVAPFHCSTVLPGNNSANLTAIGQDTFLLPESVRFIVGWLNPRCFDICSCVIMALIISNNFLYVKLFIAKYNKKLEMPVIIRKYTLVFLIKGVV